MAIPLKSLYEVEHKSDQKPYQWYYRIRIYDSELVADVNREMETEGDGWRLTYSGDEDDLLATIIPSSVILYFVVKNQTDQDFIDELSQFQESRFYIAIDRRKRNDVFIWEPFWYGVVTQDLIRYTDTRGCFPYTVEINAIDGLTRLKEKDGNILEGPAGYFDVLELFNKLFSVCLPLDMYEDTDVLFAHNIRWFCDRHPASSDGVAPIDPLRFTKVDQVYLFLNPDSSTIGYSYINWYTILDRMCKSYGCRIIHAKGRMNIIQIEQYDKRQAATIDFNHYGKKYVTPLTPNMLIDSATGTIAFNQSEDLRLDYLMELSLANGQYNLLEQYSQFKAEWKALGPQPLFTPAQQDWTIQQCSNRAVPYDVGCHLGFSKEYIGLGGPWGAYIDFYIEITEVDSPYSKRYLNQKNQWDTNSNVKRRITKTGNSPNASYVNVTWNQFLPPVPFDCTTCVRIEILGVYGFYPDVPPIYKDPIIAITLDPQPERIVYVYDIPAYAESSLSYVVNDLMFANNEDSAIVPNAVIWSYQNQWEWQYLWTRPTPAGTPSDKYSDFLGQRVINLYNDISRKKYYGTLWSDWFPFMSLEYDNHVFIANSCEFTPQSGEWIVTLLEIRDES